MWAWRPFWSCDQHHVIRFSFLDATCQVQDHRTSGSGEEDFLRFLPYMGMAAILVM